MDWRRKFRAGGKGQSKLALVSRRLCAVAVPAGARLSGIGRSSLDSEELETLRALRSVIEINSIRELF